MDSPLVLWFPAADMTTLIIVVDASFILGLVLVARGVVCSGGAPVYASCSRHTMDSLLSLLVYTTALGPGSQPQLKTLLPAIGGRRGSCKQLFTD